MSRAGGDIDIPVINLVSVGLVYGQFRVSLGLV